MNAKKNIILGVSGGISAYKSASLARLLTKHNYRVQVLLSESAKQFITPLTFQALTGIPVRDSLLDRDAEAAMGHIELARWADHIIIAPATP
jgi:phosphopantothenoylcysteine decarboxylase / phosphopantothenate---cysteine ligase